LREILMMRLLTRLRFDDFISALLTLAPMGAPICDRKGF